MTKTDDASVWRNRDFRLIWSGQTLSEFGNGLSQLAYPLLMLALTGSPAQAGALAAARALPYLFFGLIAGALADRWDRKRTMIVCELVRALNVASIPVAAALGGLTPEQLYGNGFLGGVLYVFFSAAEGACLPTVVSGRQLTSAVAAQETSQSACGVVAAPIGGALLQLSRGLPFLVDAVTFLASALCLAPVRSRFRRDDDDRQAAPGESTGTLRAEVAEGVRWLWNHSSLRLIAVTAAGLQIAISGIGLVAIVRARDIGASAALTGLLFSALGVGGVVGALLVPRLRKWLGSGDLLLSVLWLQGLLWVALVFADNLVAIALVLGLFALSMPCFGIAALSYQLEVTPDHLLGRVGTAFNVLIWAATPVGGTVAGVLLEYLAPGTTSWVFAGWVLLLSVVTTLGGGLRGLGRGTAPAAVDGDRPAGADGPGQLPAPVDEMSD
jgi:predicted MFS family arabinose efflux permease